MTPIEKKYQELGGENGFLGSATSSETPLAGGVGIYQEFSGGIIYYSPDYGACVMKSKIVEKWKSDSVAKTMTSDNEHNIRDYLGFPVRDTEAGPRNSQVNYFERGMIVAVQNAGPSSVVYGATYIRYRRHGDLNGWLGFPVFDERPSANGGRVAGFENADIHWHPNTGAFEVHGAIKGKYDSLGGDGSFLGYPISDENIIYKDGHEIGRSSNFEFGTIYWSGTTGAFEMHGLLLKSYMREFGGPAGNLGFPTSDELRSPRGFYQFNNFQNGVLTYNNGNSNIRMVSNLHVVFTKLETDEDDDDLFVNSHTTFTSGGAELKRIEKNFGEYSNTGTKTLNEQEGFVGDFPLRDGFSLLNIFMKAWDVDGGLNFGDDAIAQFNKSFSIDTLWESTAPDTSGNTLLTWYSGPDGKFRANLRIDIDGFIINPFDASNFRKDLFWHIHNPKIPTFDFATYAATFSDVEADDSPFFHPFNHIYYNAAYKDSAKTGTCFGMCLEAIYALKGRSASREPISQFGFDEQRKHDISVKFGYQLGADQIMYIISKFKSGDLWNPVKCFQQSREMFNNGNFPILCLSEGTAISGGHAILPYHWDDSNPNEWKIFVANPNTPFNENSDNSARDSIIRIDPQANTFTYKHKETQTWTGGKGIFNGGRMFPFPYNELSSEPRTPFWEAVLTFFTGGAYLLFAGDADVDQISGGMNETYFDQQGNVNTNNLTRLKNVFSIEPINDPEGVSLIHTRPDLLRTALSMFGDEKAKVFYLKNDKAIQKMYIPGRPLSERMVRTARSTELAGHLATAVHSRVFAGHLNSTTIADITAHEPAFRELDVVSAGIANIMISRSITFALRGSNDGNYTCGFASGKAKLIISSNINRGLVDQITIDGVNLAGQAVTFKTHPDAPDKRIKITLISFDDKRTYELSNIVIQPGQYLTLQHNNACKELILHNSQQSLSFDLKLFLSNPDRPVLSKQGITVDPASVVQLEPSSWVQLENEVINTPLKLETYDHIGGNIINTLLI